MQPLPLTLSLDAQCNALREFAGARVLDHLGVLALRGRDRTSWLNGLITNDVRVLPPGRSVYAAIVGLKGKILSDVYVHARSDEMLLVVARPQLTELLEHFDRYVVMEDVFLSAREATVVSLQGPRALDLAATLGEHWPADRLGRGGADLVLGDEDDATHTRLNEALTQGTLAAVSHEAWETARIEAGVPAFGVDFDGTNFVQEATITGRAVSFHKGCYLGQEVVCRLEMRGQVQKHLTALLLDGDAPPRETPVLSEGRNVGHITSAAASAALPGRSVAFAMVRRAALEVGAALTVDGRPAMVSTRPVP
jgi:folate-binding protein YgfZ